MGIYLGNSDGMTRMSVDFFEFCSLMILTAIYVQGTDLLDKRFKQASLYFFVAVFFTKFSFFFDFMSYYDWPFPPLIAQIKDSLKDLRFFSIFLPLATALTLEILTVKPLIPLRKLYLGLVAVSFIQYLALFKLHTTPTEQENEDLRQFLARTIY